MKAIVWTKYGPPEVLQLKEIDKPVPKNNEVLVKVHATTVTAGDCEMRGLNFPLFLRLPMRLYNGFRKPKKIQVLGQDLAGVVEETGININQFKKGDQVFGATDIGLGTYAEYKCLQVGGEGVLAIKPSNMSFKEAACIPTGGLEALHFLRKGQIDRGKKLLINGAGGSIGTYAVQLAKCFGAEVTAVDRNEKLEMLLSIGADHVIDYTREDFTRNGQVYDAIFDVVGKSPFNRSMRSLRKNGFFLIANPGLSKMIKSIWTSATSSKKVILWTSSRKKEDLIFLKNLVEEGKLKPVIDKSYPIEQMVEAHRYVETGLKKGNLVITVA